MFAAANILPFYNVITLSILLKNSVHSITANGKQDFLTLAVVKELFDVQARSYKSTFEILFTELRGDVSSLRREVTKLKSGLTFSQGDHRSTKRKSQQARQEIVRRV